MSPLTGEDVSATGARRSALSPLPDDDAPEIGARRSALSPLPDDDTPEVGARRSALSPLPADESHDLGARWAEESPPAEIDEAPAARGWGEATDVADTPPPRRSVQPALPDLGPPLVQPSPTDDAAPVDDSPLESPLDETSPVTPIGPADPSVQPTLPDLTPTPSWPPAHSWPPITTPAAAFVAPSPALSPADDDHALYRRPAPGEPETQWELTPISAASPPEPPAELETTILPAIDGSGRKRRAKPARQARVRAARRHPWRDHKRLLTVVSIVVAFLMVVGVGGYFLSRYNPTVSAITQGDLTLPLTAGDFRRDPSQGTTPSVHPDSKIQTVSATYSLNGVQQFLVIAYRPQTDPEAALQEIQARSVTKVNGGACGHTSDMSLACVVISGTTAVMAVTLVDQTADDLIDSAQKVADGLGK